MGGEASARHTQVRIWPCARTHTLGPACAWACVPRPAPEGAGSWGPAGRGALPPAPGGGLGALWCLLLGDQLARGHPCPEACETRRRGWVLPTDRPGPTGLLVCPPLSPRAPAPRAWAGAGAGLGRRRWWSVVPRSPPAARQSCSPPWPRPPRTLEGCTPHIGQQGGGCQGRGRGEGSPARGWTAGAHPPGPLGHRACASPQNPRLPGGRGPIPKDWGPREQLADHLGRSGKFPCCPPALGLTGPLVHPHTAPDPPKPSSVPAHPAPGAPRRHMAEHVPRPKGPRHLPPPAPPDLGPRWRRASLCSAGPRPLGSPCVPAPRT